jgi:hypothetical protein
MHQPWAALLVKYREPGGVGCRAGRRPCLPARRRAPASTGGKRTASPSGSVAHPPSYRPQLLLQPHHTQPLTPARLFSDALPVTRTCRHPRNSAPLPVASAVYSEEKFPLGLPILFTNMWLLSLRQSRRPSFPRSAHLSLLSAIRHALHSRPSTITARAWVTSHVSSRIISHNLYCRHWPCVIMVEFFGGVEVVGAGQSSALLLTGSGSFFFSEPLAKWFKSNSFLKSKH